MNNAAGGGEVERLVSKEEEVERDDRGRGVGLRRGISREKEEEEEECNTVKECRGRSVACLASPLLPVSFPLFASLRFLVLL